MEAVELSSIADKSASFIELKKKVEVLLFVHDKPLSSKQIINLIGEQIEKTDIDKCLTQIARELNNSDKPYSLEQLAGGWQFLTRPEYDKLINKLVEVKKQESLTKAQLETLSVVAYSQPITKHEIESIRGVGCGPVLKVLQERDFIRITGRAEKLGAPVIYGTTARFMELFGLNDISELPERDEIIKTFKTKLNHSNQPEDKEEENAKKN
jgi:segregation and condensation protein B